MINKKRLAMMAVAASMMLPTNLAYLSMATPVLAESTGTSTDSSMEEETPDTSNKEGVLESQKEFLDLFKEDAGNYVLNDDTFKAGTEYSLKSGLDPIKLDKPLLINKAFTIDLGGNTLIAPDSTATDGLKDLFNVQADITIKNGTLKTAPQTTSAPSIVHVKAKATVNIANVTFEAAASPNIYCWAVTVQKDDQENPTENGAGSTITIKDSIIKTDAGITVNGNITKNDDLTTINIENTEFNSDLGIYQAGTSTINVLNSTLDCTKTGTVDEQCGIEVRSGTLKVENCVVKGGSTKASTVNSNGNGTTTTQAGIAVAQHTTKQNINVTIKNSKISGYTALAIVNPQKNNPNMEDSTIEVTDSILEGAKEGYDVAYTPEAYKSFKFTTTTFQKDETPRKVAIDVDKFKDEELKAEAPYKIEEASSPQSTPSTNLALPKDDNLNLTIKDGKLDSSSLNTVKQALQNQVNEATSNKVLKPHGEDTEVALGYKYDVVEVSPDVQIQGTEGYGFKAKVTATLSSDSIVRLMVPLRSPIPTSTPDPKAPETVLYVNEDDEVKDLTYPMDVKLSDITDLNDPKKLNSLRIQLFIVTKGAPLSNCYDEDKISDFDGTPIKDTYVVERINVPIEIAADGTVNNPEYKAPTTSVGGGTHKPKPKPEEPAPTTPVGTPTTMYRLYNKLTGEHLYTIDKNERDNLLTSDTWKDEGQGWIAPSFSDYPVYRLLNPNNGDHHYTTDKNEFDTLPTYGWVAEGVAFFSADKNNTENVILHRLYNPNAEGAGSHHYTADTNERDALVAQGWTYEGTAWAGLPETK